MNSCSENAVGTGLGVFPFWVHSEVQGGAQEGRGMVRWVRGFHWVLMRKTALYSLNIERFDERLDLAVFASRLVCSAELPAHEP